MKSIVDVGQDRRACQNGQYSSSSQGSYLESLGHDNSDIIRLNVGGEVHTTSRSTLCNVPGTMLQTMMRSGIPKRMIDGQIFIDRDPKHFRLVLNFLRDGCIPIPQSQQDVGELIAEAQYYQIPQLVQLLEQSSTTRAAYLRKYVKLKTLDGLHSQVQRVMDTILELAYGPPYSQSLPLYLHEQELWLNKPQSSRSMIRGTEGSIEYVYIKRISDGTFLTKNSCDEDYDKFNLFRFLTLHHALVIEHMRSEGFQVEMFHPDLHCSTCHSSSVFGKATSTCHCIFVCKVHVGDSPTKASAAYAQQRATWPQVV